MIMMGSPNARIWPEVMNMPLVRNGTIDLEREMLRSPYNNLSTRCPKLNEHGLDLLNQFLTYDPALRISGRKALHHSFFTTSPLPTEEEFMPIFSAPADDHESQTK